MGTILHHKDIIVVVFVITVTDSLDRQLNSKMNLHVLSVLMKFLMLLKFVY